jgi:hypothetical protein
MSGYEWQFGELEVTFHCVEIRVAYSTGSHFYEYFSFSGFRLRQFLETEWRILYRAGLVQNHRFHIASPAIIAQKRPHAKCKNVKPGMGVDGVGVPYYARELR